MDDMYIGKLLDDRYEILEKIGSGGMAVVYKARCHRLNRFVAIKILKSDLAQNPDLRRRFHAESQAVAMLSHPNIVSVYDVNHTDNLDYIVMELIEGITLKQYINRRGVLNWKEALHFTTQIVKALEHAHSRGIIHRDIKPHNIMILKDGNVKVADFGIARLLTTKNTLTQEALGSVHYISPEQAKGSAVDARSDLYSVGVVMYEMLTSRLPFEGDSPVSVAIQHISAIPLQPREINPDIPIGLEDITMHAMNPNIHTRYASATEMLADLEEFRKNPSVRFNYSAVPSVADDGEDEDGSTRKIPSAAIAAAQHTAPRKKNGNAISRNRVSPAEYRRNKRKAGSTSVMVGLFCILVFLIAMGMVIWKYVKPWFAPDDVPEMDVPNFVGKVGDEVISNGDYTPYFEFIVVTEESDAEAGEIIRQSPAAQRKMSLTSDKIKVTLTVSSGTKPILMPKLVNKYYIDAELILKQLGLPNLTYEFHPTPSWDYTKDHVFEQIPAEGEPLYKDRPITVHIYYSSGRPYETRTVPNLIGKSSQEAEGDIFSAELTPKLVSQYNDLVPVGEVFDQNPQPDDEVEINSEVTFYVSLGPQPAPVEVPNLYGKTVAEATELLKERDLQIKVSIVEDDAPVDQIFDQSHPAGAMVTPHTVITVYISGLAVEGTDPPEDTGSDEGGTVDTNEPGNLDGGEPAE